MFSEWDECVPGCKCPKCLERKRVHDEMVKDMTWEDYGNSIPLEDILEKDVPRGTKPDSYITVNGIRKKIDSRTE